MAAVESELPIVILGAGISGNVSFAKGEGGGGGGGGGWVSDFELNVRYFRFQTLNLRLATWVHKFGGIFIYIQLICMGWYA